MRKLLQDQILKLYPTLERILYRCAVYRVIISQFKTEGGIIEDTEQYELWTEMGCSTLQTAVIEWCTVFGFDENPFHYSINAIEFDRSLQAIDKAVDAIFSSVSKIQWQYDLDGYQELKNSYESSLFRIEKILSDYKKNRENNLSDN